MTLTPLHRAILRKLGEKPLEHQDASEVQRSIPGGLYNTMQAICDLEKWGQLVMFGLDDPNPETKLTLLLTPSGRITATGAALGITSVMLPVAKESGLSTSMGLGAECENGAGRLAESYTPKNPIGPVFSQIDATLAKLDRLPCIQREFAGERAVADSATALRRTQALAMTSPAIQVAESPQARDTCGGSTHLPSFPLGTDGDCLQSPSFQVDSFVDRVFTICERAERDEVPEEEKWDDGMTRAELYGGIRLVK